MKTLSLSLSLSSFSLLSLFKPPPHSSSSVSPLNYFIEKNTMYRGVEQRGKRYRAQIVVSKKRRSLFSFILNLSPLYLFVQNIFNLILFFYYLYLYCFLIPFFFVLFSCLSYCDEGFYWHLITVKTPPLHFSLARF